MKNLETPGKTGRGCRYAIARSLSETPYVCVIGGLEPSNLKDYMIEIHRVGNDRPPSQKSGTRRENTNAPDSPDLSMTIPDKRGYLFISRQNLGRSGNSHISDRLGFSQHMKTTTA